GHARARPRLRARRWRVAARQLAHAADRAAEQRRVVVFGRLAVGRHASGFGHPPPVCRDPARGCGIAAHASGIMSRPHPTQGWIQRFMRVLVSNDDGVDAPGIRILAQGLRDAGHEVLIVAPDRDRSGASNSLTLDMPLRVQQLEKAVWRVYGTPTDCVHVAITGMFEEEPDIVVSGINNTANLGDDVIYSGTVAAAMEGRFLGLPAIAMSLATVNHDGRHYETAARAAVEIVERLKADPLPADTILNVNVPDRAWNEIAGF